MDQVKKKVVVVDNYGDRVEKWIYYPFRSLTNYKEIHRGLAKKKGVSAEFESADTLTRARRLLFG